MRTRRKLRDYLRENSRATNQEISESLGINEGNVKTTLSRMRRDGEIEIMGSGANRQIKVTFVEVNTRGSFKREALQELADQLIEANKSETNAYEIRENGKLLIRVLEKL